jgi:hypothetical protein
VVRSTWRRGDIERPLPAIGSAKVKFGVDAAFTGAVA